MAIPGELESQSQINSSSRAKDTSKSPPYPSLKLGIKMVITFETGDTL